jgi:2-methylcitrate dehydratase PrpD
VSNETHTLAEFAHRLRFEDIPADVLAVAKACLIDTVGTALFGSRLPWCGSITDYAKEIGGGGRTLLARDFPRLNAPAAALANGTFSHAFEFDSLRQPERRRSSRIDRPGWCARGGTGAGRIRPRSACGLCRGL